MAATALNTSVRWFWNIATIGGVLLIGGFVYSEYLTDRLAVADDGRPFVLEPYVAEIERELPGVLAFQEATLDAVQKEDIQGAIDREIDAAFAPVYANLPAYLDFHYSVVGEYTQLTSALLGRYEGTLREKLFDEVGFDAALEQAGGAVHGEATAAIGVALGRIGEKARADLNLSFDDMGRLGDVVTLSQADALRRFEAPLTGARAAAAVVGAGAVTLGARAFARQLGRRVAARTAAKGAGRAAGVGGGAGAGAAAGSVLGPVGAAVGGAIGAVAAWIATDAVIIKVDELMNRDEFKAELTAMIDRQKAETKAGLLQTYADAVTAINTRNRAAFEALTPRDRLRQSQ